MSGKVLKVLGSIFTVVLVIGAAFGLYVWYSGNQNSVESEKFARESMEAVAKHWSASEVLNRFNPRIRAQIGQTELQKTLDTVKRNGGLKELKNLEGALLLVKSFEGDPDSAAVYRGRLTLEKHAYVMRLYVSKSDGRWFIDQIDLCDESIPDSLVNCRL